jgi:hypothetical protein
MKRTKWTLVVVLMALTSLMLTAQNPADLVGTWEGEATLESEAEPNVLTLVLEIKEGKLVGHLTDQFETWMESPVEELTLEEGVLSFAVNAETPGGDFLVKFAMKVEGNSMKGDLEIPDMGLKGTWEATKK